MCQTLKVENVRNHRRTCQGVAQFTSMAIIPSVQLLAFSGAYACLVLGGQAAILFQYEQHASPT